MTRGTNGRRSLLPLRLLLFVLFFPLSLSAIAIVGRDTTPTSSDEGTPASSPKGGSRHSDKKSNLSNLIDPPAAPTALLVALEDGEAGLGALREWSAYAGEWSNTFPPVWVLCSNQETENLVRETPNVLPFFADKKSWGVVLAERFLLQKANIFGFFGEGSLPHPGLAESIASLQAVSELASGTPPTGILSRSRLRGGGGAGRGTVAGRYLLRTGGGGGKVDGDYFLRGGGKGVNKMEGEWLSDKFVGQMWCNRAVLSPSRLSGAGLYQRAVKDMSLLETIGLIVGASAGGEDVLLVDGSDVVRSTFASSKQDDERVTSPVDNGESNNDFRIGGAKFALGSTGYFAEGGAQDVRIEIASWPPRYVLETVAIGRKAGGGGSKGGNGLVIVSSANCGRLDIATNFLMSARRASGAKVLHVATDEVAFDFMDKIAPGCTALIPAELSLQLARHRASTDAEAWDPAFSAESLLRSYVLRIIVDQGYAVLWSDSDVVWIKNPLPLLPDVNDPLAAEVMMIQQDESEDSGATSFLFAKPTFFAKALLKAWGENIQNVQAGQVKMPFREPLHKLEAIGLKSSLIPNNASPRFRDFSNQPYVENYAHVTKPEAIMVQNGWNTDNDTIERLELYHIWDVGHLSFPGCP